MTDSSNAATPPDPYADPVPASGGGGALSLARLALAGVVLLAIGLYLVWANPPETVPGTMTMMRGQMDMMAAKLGELSSRPPPPPPDLSPLTARLDALEKRPVAQATNLAPIESRLAALEGRPVGASPADIAGLASRLDGFAQRGDQLSQREQTDTADLAKRLDAAISRLDAAADKSSGALATLAGALDTAAAANKAAAEALSAKLDAASAQQKSDLAALTTQQKSDVAGLTTRLDAIDARLTKLEQDSAQIGALADRTRTLARLQSAQAALDGGQPLGDLPGAPATLSRFAHDAPPTVAGLRLSFPEAASAAQQASLPAGGSDKQLLDRMWSRMEQTVTVRQGDDLLVGNPVGGILAKARSALEAGDVDGAVASLGALSGPPAAAMKPWLDQAHALLDARAALAALEGHA